MAEKRGKKYAGAIFEPNIDKTFFPTKPVCDLSNLRFSLELL